MIRRPPRSTQSRSSAASDVYKRQPHDSGAFRIPLFILVKPALGHAPIPVTVAYCRKYRGAPGLGQPGRAPVRPRGTLFAVEFLINSLVAKAGMGAGFSGLSGLRAFMPLGLLGLASHLDLWAGLDLGGTPFALLENSWVIAALLILAAFEMAADKVPLLA